MAIQLPNPGLGDGQTGDNEYVMWTKVKNNFNNNSHAASRLVGTDKNNIVQAQDVIIAASEVVATNIAAADYQNFDDIPNGSTILSVIDDINPVTESGDTIAPFSGHYVVNKTEVNSTVSINAYSRGLGEHYFNYKSPFGDWWGWEKTYSTVNTTTDSNKNIKASSPVVRVFSDHLDKIHEANDLPIKYTRNGVGDYTIEGTTGLRENDWQIVIPKDDHDNQLIAFTIEDDNGTIRLKTYKRTFSMETFTFGPDLDTSLDIPEGRWVDLHFNDLPDEDDTQMEV